MKISQVNNQQTNFKSGIVAEKGSVALAKRMFPKFATALEREPETVLCVKENLHGLDFFWFDPSIAELGALIDTALCYHPCMSKGYFADSMLKPNTMDNLVDLSRHLYEA